MILLRRVYRLLPTSTKQMLRPLLEYYYRAIAIYRLPNNQLPGYKLSGQDATFYIEDYEKNLISLLERIVHEGDICVDVGAHMGYVTLLFAKLVGEKGYVYAFEAHPTNAKQVTFNLQQNHMSNRVKVENMAIADGKAKKLTIYAGRDNAAAEWNIVGHDVYGNPTQAVLKIPATSLDDYFSASMPINIVKMDIEGAEALALTGMRRVLREQRPAIVIEFHSEEGWQGRQELLQANYRLFDINSGQWLEEPLNHPRVYHCLAVPGEAMDDWKTRVKAQSLTPQK
jgi:FkbM family methyltransferase